MSGRLAGKFTVITGAASGIGLATARLFANEGAVVAMLDLNPQALREAATAIGNNTLPVAVDVADEAGVSDAFSRLQTEFDRIDAVVNYAGITRAEPFETMSLATWDTVLRVNLTGSFLVARAAAQAMQPQGHGSIVLVGSRIFLGAKGNINYAASKGGVVSLARSMALMLEGANVRVNVLAPGRTATPMGEARNLQAVPRPAQQTRVARAEEIAAAALFLASDDSAFVSGQVLLVDGSRSTKTAPL